MKKKKATQAYRTSDHHEVAVGSTKREADLHKHMLLCYKNPGHINFISSRHFNIEHLPPAYQDQDLVQLIKYVSDLTARVRVKRLSKNRPRYFPGHSQDARASDNTLRTGTGWLWHVDRYTKMDNKVCECKMCRKSKTSRESKQKDWAVLFIMTSAHVVCDETESEYATCDFFYNDGKEDGGEERQIRGFEVVTSHMKKDWCMMRYVTHDIEPVEKLLDKFSIHKSLLVKVCKKFGNCMLLESDWKWNARESLVVIVSHPHGMSKCISLGTVLERHCLDQEDIILGGKQFRGEWTQYTYSASTCPGSSGAPVLILGKGWWGVGINYVHSQGHIGNINLCGIHWEPTSREDEDKILCHFRQITSSSINKDANSLPIDLLKRKYLDQMVEHSHEGLNTEVVAMYVDKELNSDTTRSKLTRKENSQVKSHNEQPNKQQQRPQQQDQQKRKLKQEIHHQPHHQDMPWHYSHQNWQQHRKYDYRDCVSDQQVRRNFGPKWYKEQYYRQHYCNISLPQPWIQRRMWQTCQWIHQYGRINSALQPDITQGWHKIKFPRREKLLSQRYQHHLCIQQQEQKLSQCPYPGGQQQYYKRQRRDRCSDYYTQPTLQLQGQKMPQMLRQQQ